MSLAPKSLTAWWGKNKKKALIGAGAFLVVWGFVSASGRPDTSAETIPDGYTSAGRDLLVHADKDPGDPQPLVLILHDNSSSARQMEELSDASDYFGVRDVAVVYPEAVAGTWRIHDERGADIQYLRDIIRYMAEERSDIDLSKVYVWGFGEGGRLAAVIACETPERQFAAVGAVGRFDPVTVPQCPPDVPLLWIEEEGWNDDTTKDLWAFSEDPAEVRSPSA